MIKITENKNYIWIIPLVSGIIVIIGLLTPMVYENLIESGYYGILKADIYWWIWCFVSVSMSYGGYSISQDEFVSDSAFLIPSIITTVIIILVAINLFILAKSTKTRKIDKKHFNSSIISGMTLIFTMIIYMIVIDAVVYNGVDIFGQGVSSAGIHFWSEFDIGFGVIAPFISGIIAIIGAGIFKYYLKQEDEAVPRKVLTERGVELIEPAVDNSLKFCHSCGAKIKKTSAYCEFCGIAQ